jgi:hypothetical protein
MVAARKAHRCHRAIPPMHPAQAPPRRPVCRPGERHAQLVAIHCVWCSLNGNAWAEVIGLRNAALL